jgi:hypothetical protein
VDASRGLDDVEGVDDDDDDVEGVVSADIDDEDALLPPIFFAPLFLFPEARKTYGARTTEGIPAIDRADLGGLEATLVPEPPPAAASFR